MEQKRPGPPGIVVTAIVLLSIGWVIFTAGSAWVEPGQGQIVQSTEVSVFGLRFKYEVGWGYWNFCERMNDIPAIGYKGYERCRDTHENHCRADICGDLGDDCCAPPGEPRVCKLPGHTVKPGGVTSYGQCEALYGESAIYECCPDNKCDEYTGRIDGARASSIIAILLSATYLAFIIVDCACKKVLVSWLGGLFAILSFLFTVITWCITLGLWSEEFCDQKAFKDQPDIHLGQGFYDCFFGSMLIGASVLMHWINRSFCEHDTCCNECCSCCNCCCPHCFVDDMAEHEMDARNAELENANEPGAMTNEPSKAD